MNNARETFNAHVNDLVSSLLPEFNQAVFNEEAVSLYTGDEHNPQVKPPSVEIHWLDEHPGLKPESRAMMVQLTLRTVEKQTRKGDKACDTLLEGLGLRTGSSPMKTIPKKNFEAGLPGIEVGTQLIYYRYGGKGWSRVRGEEQQERIYVLTLLVDYVPG